MTTANDLIVVFLALEMLSIPLYVLAAFDRRRLRSQEAGIKYFVLGAFSSAIFLYGIALVYGATGTTSLTGIATFLAQNTLFEQGTLLAGLGAAARRARLQGGGGAVPHVDARRVPGRAHAGHRVHGVGHEGRRASPRCCASSRRVPHVPRPTGARSCGCSPCSRSPSAASARWCRPTSSGCSRTRRSRTPATSSWRVEAGTPKGREAALFYLFVYSFMSIGSFAVVTALSRQGDDEHSDRRLPRPRRCAVRCSAACSCSSCSPRPASRSPVASSRSSRCSRPPPRRTTTCSS